ncbi:MAG: hypothetical protein IPJ75_06325 [Ignavibacteriales bacterium]|nr:hypothetical protein [Ignavibacteriales bacterium]
MRDHGYIVELGLKNSELFKLINNDFVLNPALKVQYYPVYISLLRRVKADIADSLIKMDMAEFASKNDPDEYHLVALVRGHEILRDVTSADKYREVLASKFPKNNLVKLDRFQKTRKETDLTKQKELIKKFAVDFPGTRELTVLIDGYMNTFSKDIEWPKVEKEIVASGLEPSLVFYTRSAKKYLSEKDPKPDLSPFYKQSCSG